MKLGAKTFSQPRGGRDQELSQTALGFRLVTDVFLSVGLPAASARQHVTTFVLRVAGVALDPFPFHLVALECRSNRCHRSTFLTGFLSAVFQPRFFQLWIQLVMPGAHTGCRC